MIVKHSLCLLVCLDVVYTDFNCFVILTDFSKYSVRYAAELGLGKELAFVLLI